jgi:hypothetical protein
MTASLLRRLVALEDKLVVDRGVVGLCIQTPAEAARVEETVAGLHAAGYSVVYIANLGGPRTVAASPEQGGRLP